MSVLLYCWGGGTTVHSDWVLWLQTALVVSFNVNSLPWTEAGCFGLSTPILWFSSRRWFLKFTNKQLATWETRGTFFLCQCNSEVYLCFAGDIDLKLGGELWPILIWKVMSSQGFGLKNRCHWNNATFQLALVQRDCRSEKEQVDSAHKLITSSCTNNLFAHRHLHQHDCFAYRQPPILHVFPGKDIKVTKGGIFRRSRTCPVPWKGSNISKQAPAFCKYFLEEVWWFWFPSTFHIHSPKFKAGRS